MRARTLLVALAALLLVAGGFIGRGLVDDHAASAGGHWKLAERRPQIFDFTNANQVNAYLQTLDASCNVQVVSEAPGDFVIAQNC